MSEIYRLTSIEKQLTDFPEFLSITEVAGILRVSYMSVWRIIRFGQIDATLVGGSWRIPKFGLIDYLQNNNVFNLN